MERSICEYFYSPGEPKGHRCGYCKSEDTKMSGGMWVHRLTVGDYQDLIDRGWRRSGKYCYKPMMSKTCCPLYTISCSVKKFRISKSQKSCLKDMNKFLVYGKCKKVSTSSTVDGNCYAKVGGSASLNEADLSSTPNPVLKKPVRPGVGPDPSKPLCRKSKEIRREKKSKKKIPSVEVGDDGDEQANKGSGGYVGVNDVSVSKPVQESAGVPNRDTIPEFLKEDANGKKPLESFLSVPSVPKNLHNLEIKLIRSMPPSPEFKETFSESFALYKKYQMSVHKDKSEDCSESVYQRFLCDSPLIPMKGQAGWPCDYGSYHQHYRIDGKLIAVGVIDILPKCLSAVYVYYDTDYSFLTLGKYSTMREIEMTRKLHLCDPEKFKYYYMGYYVHTCQKMHYKGNYTPSFLLCPESYNFIPIEACLPKIDQAKYSRLCDGETIPENVEDWLGETLILKRNTIFRFSVLLSRDPRTKHEEDKVKEYSTLVGRRVALRMLLYLQ